MLYLFFQSLVRNHHKERCSTPYCHVSKSRSRFYTFPLTVAVKKTIYVLHDVISHTIIWSHNLLNSKNFEWSVEKWTLGPCVPTFSLGSYTIHRFYNTHDSLKRSRLKWYLTRRNGANMYHSYLSGTQTNATES